MSHSRSLLPKCLALIAMASASALASEYHGSVTARGLPFPGVTVTAIARRPQGDRRSRTRAAGFPSRTSPTASGTSKWPLLGFEKLTREVAVAPGAPAPDVRAEVPHRIGDEPAIGSRARRVRQPRAPFQRLAVNQAAETTAIAGQGTLRTEEIADLTQSSANSFLVQGSVSSALGMGAEERLGSRRTRHDGRRWAALRARRAWDWAATANR